MNYDLTDETALLDENGADGTTQSEVMDTASPGEAVLTGASDFAAQAKSAENRYAPRTKRTCRRSSATRISAMRRSRMPSIPWFP